ncbi:hypothetical protein IGI04_023269 [Brassica rapa subsp. trilocularis]|uniref:Uncharacterized protein n=1 Tax=Brassica rapa subsp. trilocularis TaxID=1813537 RepID=A0ABQ7M7K1_BRACM|nr:hypothetical protein IGI04_023269 [Brassica rapa subsp. trilocularis]
MLPPEISGATTCQDIVKLVITINRSLESPETAMQLSLVSPSSCSSRRDEAVDTDHAEIGAQTKPYAPPEVTPTARVSFTRSRRISPPPASATLLRRSSDAAGNFLRCLAAFDTGKLRHCRRQIDFWSKFDQVDFDQRVDLSTDTETNFCMPDCIRLWPTLVDRLSCSLEVSINRPRAVSKHYLELCYVFGLAMSGSMDYWVASHTSLSDSPVAHPSLFPFSGETNKYVIFGRTWCYWTFSSDFIWVLGECNWVYGLLYYMILLVAHRVISFFGHDFEVIQEWICEVSATNPLQAIVPRVYLFCEFVEIAFKLGCGSLRSVDVGVTLGMLPVVANEEKLKEKESERKKDRNHCMLPPEIAGATTCQDIVELVITINRSLESPETAMQQLSFVRLVIHR